MNSRTDESSESFQEVKPDLQSIDFYECEAAEVPEEIDPPGDIPEQTWYVMRKLEDGLTQNEVGEKLGISLNSVRNILSPVRGDLIQVIGASRGTQYRINLPENIEDSQRKNTPLDEVKKFPEMTKEKYNEIEEAFPFNNEIRSGNEQQNNYQNSESSKEKLNRIRKAREREREDDESDNLNLEENGFNKIRDEKEPPTISEVFTALKNSRRRKVLRYLKEHDEATLSTLSDEMAKLEDEEIPGYSSDTRKTIYVGLYQCHLPRMDEMGLVEFDSDRGKVEVAEYFEEASQYLPNSFGEGDAELTFDDGFWQKMRREVDRFTNIFYR